MINCLSIRVLCSVLVFSAYTSFGAEMKVLTEKEQISEEFFSDLKKRAFYLDDSDISSWMQGQVKDGTIHLVKSRVSSETYQAIRYSFETLGEYPKINEMKNGTPISVLSKPAW